MKTRPGQPGVPPATEISIDASPRFARSRQMVSCLRRGLLYSEKRARDILCASIRHVLAANPPGTIIVARLTREASRVARTYAERAGYEYANWNTASRAVMKALLCSASLLAADGVPIPFDVTGHAAAVGALHDDHQDRMEAFLLEFLLRSLGDVTARDHTALAHALFRQFDRSVPMHDLEDRVVILLARLADRIVLDGETYVVRDVDGVAHPAHA